MKQTIITIRNKPCLYCEPNSSATALPVLLTPKGVSALSYHEVCEAIANATGKE